MHTKTTTYRTTLLTQALAAAFGVLAFGALAPAFAQSNATGTIFGQVGDAAGATIVLENTATGARRSVTPDANGRYQATSMAPGRYQVRLVRGASVESALEVEALVGTGVEATFGRNAAQSVVVQARANRIDVSNTDNGTVFTARQLASLPISQDVAAIIQLAPGTVKNTLAVYGNVSSFGGAGVSENAYYVNGFPVTNILTQVGASELPFGAIANAQVLSGGYSAEFGRATGGVVNITTKSGTNTWEFGAKASVAPNRLRSRPLETYYPNTGTNPATDGKLQFHNSDNTTDARTYGLYAGGPIIRDKLFVFGAFEQTRTDSTSVGASFNTPVSRTGYTETAARLERYLIKVDYNLSDAHRFEYTRIHDNEDKTARSYGYNLHTRTRDSILGNAIVTTNCCGGGSNPGAEDDILKYTGYLADNLIVTALYGASDTTHRRAPEVYDPTLFQTQSSPTSRVPGLTYPNPQVVTGSLPAPESGDHQRTIRLDLEYKIGNHSLRAGIDRNKVNSVVGSTRAGGGSWVYRYNLDPNFKPFGAFETLAQGGGYGPQGYYVSKDLNNSIARPTSVQSAQYIQDRYQVSDNVLLDLGLRNEQFTNNNSVAQPFIEQTHQIAPRLGATWDFNRDGSLKIFANAGRYFMQVPSNLSSNVAGVLLSTSTNYTYTGVDQATGAPTGLHAISDATSVNNTFGQSKDPRQLTAIDIKPLYQDEISIGFEKIHSPSLNLGVMATYRTLKSSNDDFCDQRPIDAWAARNGYDTSDYSFPCAIVNPGEANSLLLDLEGKGTLTQVDLSAADMGLPKLRRTYAAVNVFAEHPMRDGWYGKLTYTWSRSAGNNEGQVDSFQGGDVGLTVGWDHKELMLNANGYLPNDRRHVVKAYGYYQLSPEWTVGGNLQLVSGRPRNCVGDLPAEIHEDLGYGGSYFFCYGKPTPRGSLGRLPWLTQLDMNLSYHPALLRGLSIKADVFNVFKRTTVTSENGAQSDDGGGTSATYLQATGRQAPRSARLTAEYNYRF